MSILMTTGDPPSHCLVIYVPPLTNIYVYSRGFGGMGGYGSVSSTSSSSGHGTFSPPYRGGTNSSHPHGASSLISSVTAPSASSHNSLLIQGMPRATAGGIKSTTFVCDIDAVCKVNKQPTNLSNQQCPCIKLLLHAHLFLFSFSSIFVFSQAKGDRSPQQHMIIKRTTPGTGLGIDPEGKSRGNSPERPANAADAGAKYGIIGTQVSRDLMVG